MANGTVLVTGGAGFIGSHVVDLLLDRGYHVRVFDKLVGQVHDTGKPRHLSDAAELVVGDMRDASALARALVGVDSVLNLAAEVGVGQSMYEIVRYVDGNSGGTAVLLELLSQGSYDIGRLVVASSMSVYGEGAYHCGEHGLVAPRPRAESDLVEREWEVRCPVCALAVRPVPTSEDKALQPTSIYAISKLDQELMTLSIGEAYGISTAALRFFNTYGTRQALSNPYTGVGAIFSSRLMNGHAPLVFEDGQQLRDFVHVSDVARAVVLAMESPEASGVACNIGTGAPISVADVARTLASHLGSDIAPQITEQFRAGDIRHCWADPARAAALFGFTAEVSFAEGVAELMDWVSAEEATDLVDRARAELSARGLTT